MTNEILKQCKRKGCFNPVLKGKYCEQCTQKRKEKKDKILAGLGGIVILGGGAALRKGVIKQVPKIAVKVVKEVFKV